MNAKMRTVAAVARKPGGPYALEEVELNGLYDDEVLVRTLASGICHTDLLAETRLALPAVLGHEGAGVVEAVGARTTRVRVGQQVIVSYPSCGACAGCVVGRPYGCAQHMALAFDGCRPLDRSRPLSLTSGEPLSCAFFQASTFARHLITCERNVVAIDGDHRPELLAAIACGVQTGAGAVMNCFRSCPLDSLAVFGVGGVGMSAVLAAKLSGAYPLIAIDVLPERLELALELGATHAVDATRPNVVSQVRAIAKSGVSHSLETSGVAESLDAAIAVLAIGGECGMVIAPRLGERYPFSPTEVFSRAAKLTGIIQGSAVPASFLPRLMELHALGRFPLERLVRIYPFEAINDALDDMRRGRALKPVLSMDRGFA